MAEIPYRLWSDDVPAPQRPTRTVVAKLKPSTPAARRLAFGAAAPADGGSASRLQRLIENARLRAVTPVFSDTPRAGVAGIAAAAPVDRARGLVTIEVARGEDPKKMARHLETMGAEVEYAYVPPPRRMFAKRKKARKKPAGGPGVDPLASRQWGHAAIRLPDARVRKGFKESSGVVVAVADSGIDVKHPDLKGMLAEYKNFIKGEGARDFEGHGTHVAGIIAAEMNNGVGISGVCASMILGLKVLPSRVEWDAAAYYRGLGYCIGRARVLNLSLGADEFDPGEQDVIEDLIAAGIVVIAAMGNEFEEGNPIEYPAAIRGVCAVGATDQADRRGGFSNTGKHISLSAPGVSIVSTTPTYKYPHGARNYDSLDGTSMATPHVSAAAALLLAAHPDLTPAQVISRLQKSAKRVPTQKKRPSVAFGFGRLDVAALLA